MIRLAIAAGAIAAIGFLYWRNIEAADSAGYNRCLADARSNVESVNREIHGNNAEYVRRRIEQEGRLKVLSVDALTGVKNIPSCAASECSLESRFIDKLGEIRK